MPGSRWISKEEFQTRVRELELACQSRDRAALKKGIPLLIGKAGSQAVVRSRALDWYWRSGLHREGAQLSMTRPGDGALVSSQQELLDLPEEQRLWASRFLISIGAWPFGESLLGQLHPRSTRGKILLAMDHLALGDHVSVIQVLNGVSRSPAHEERWHVITTFARSWIELGEPKRALEWCSRGLEVVKNDPDRWVIECLHARAMSILGNHRKALESFLRADGRMSNLPSLAPHWYGYSRIWLGEIFAGNGRRVEAGKVFERAIQHYRDGMQDFQPWRMLLVLDSMRTLELLKPGQKEAFDRYPLKPPICRNQTLQGLDSNRPSSVFRLTAEERYQDGRWAIGIPLEWRLAAGLALAGDLGIHTNLLKCWLWPDSLNVFFQLDARLNQLLHRLRNEHSVEVVRERECLRLPPESRKRISVDVSPGGRPGWLEKLEDRDFLAADLADAYGISPRMAQNILATWIERGWVRRTGSARATRYRLAG